MKTRKMKRSEKTQSMRFERAMTKMDGNYNPKTDQLEPGKVHKILVK